MLESLKLNFSSAQCKKSARTVVLMHPEKSAGADSKQNNLLWLNAIISHAGNVRLHFCASARVLIGSLSKRWYNLVRTTNSGESTSGVQKHSKMIPSTKMLNTKIGVPKSLMSTTKIADDAHPIENLTKPMLNAEALYSAGAEFGSEDSAAAT